MMKQYWDSRYSSREFVYGIAPNAFYKQQLDLLKVGKILFPAEGEGRNAVYAATRGWEVTAFDISMEAKKKAHFLAGKSAVDIKYLIGGYESIQLDANAFDCIVLIYAHMPNTVRSKIHCKLLNSLKTGGTIILEAFSKEQLKFNSGGPPSEVMLYSVEEMETDFSSLSEKKIWQEEINLCEGKLHNGKASVVRLVGKK